jgi:hypothetical protein
MKRLAATVLFAACGPVEEGVVSDCRRDDVPGVGVSFVDCAEQAVAIVTHGPAPHCAPGPGSSAELRHVVCDDGLELVARDGVCTLLSDGNDGGTCLTLTAL